METKAEKSKKKRKTKKRKKGDMNNVCLSFVASQCTVTLDPIIMLPHLLERIQLIRFVFSIIPSPFSTWIEFSIKKITLQIFGGLNGLFCHGGVGGVKSKVSYYRFLTISKKFPLFVFF